MSIIVKMKNQLFPDFLIVKKFCCMYNNCMNEYSSKYNLQRHIEINHLKSRLATCTICGREFVSQDSMREHRYIHMKVKPYRCTICGTRFRNKCTFIRHQRSHTFESEEFSDSNLIDN